MRNRIPPLACEKIGIKMHNWKQTCYLGLETFMFAAMCICVRITHFLARTILRDGAVKGLI